MTGAARAGGAEIVQRAAGVIVAKHRGDLAGAEALLGAFTSETEKAGAFYLLAEVALGLVRAQSGQSMDELVRELNLLLERALAGPPD
ncbi:superoxide dismutase [Dactylosporangium sp. NPDC050688]|uniref:superoxide dismutase n=1 Tax=Dactylosporangium sp. NPDC050688 TaxID=3157217 RepID=UPI0033D9642E